MSEAAPEMPKEPANADSSRAHAARGHSWGCGGTAGGCVAQRGAAGRGAPTVRHGGAIPDLLPESARLPAVCLRG